MIKDEYTIENDYPLMESINHYAKISNNDDYRPVGGIKPVHT